MAPYSMDLRTRVLRDADAGMPSKELAGKYSVNLAWVNRLKQRRRETGEVAPRKQTKFRGSVLAGLEERLASAPGRLPGTVAPDECERLGHGGRRPR